MKFSNLFMTGLLSTCIFTACQDNDDNSVWGDSNDIVFNTQIKGAQSRVNGSTWDNGDEIGIFMQTKDAEVANKKYLASSNGNLTAAPGQELKYPADGTAKFLAYHPYTTNVNGKEVTVSVANQSNLGKIDFLYSSNATTIEKGQVVNLEFAHKLASISVNIASDNTVGSTDGLTVTLTGMNTSATFNLEDGILTPKPSVADIAMKVSTDHKKAQAIILPITSTEGMKMVFALNGQKFEWNVTVPDQKGFEANYQYTFNATLSNFNGQGVVKMGTAQIKPWIDKPSGEIKVDLGNTKGKENILLTENFDTDKGGFTITNVTAPTSGKEVWSLDSFDNKGQIVPALTYMKASAFDGGTKYASESWLVSENLQLPADKDATLAFHHCHKFSTNPTTELTLWVAEAGTQISSAATGWTKVTIPAYGSGNDYEYVLASVNLAAYKGKKIQFAFRYISTTSSASTWQINDVKVYTEGGNAEGGESTEGEQGGEGTEGGESTEGGQSGEGTGGEQGSEGQGAVTTLFEETFGELNPNDKIKIKEYKGWSDSHHLTYSCSAENADIRATASLNAHVWFPSKKESDLKIEGFKTTNYKNITLTYKITSNGTGSQESVKISTDKGNVTIPSLAIGEKNAYQEVKVNLPSGFTYLLFAASANTNPSGYRIDDIKIIGTAN